MGEVLSQNEIDNLLAALSAGELDVDKIQDEDEKQVKNYDFNRPAKFSKEHLRTLEIIYEHYGRLISTNLPVYLRKNVQVTVASSETVAFSEFSNAFYRIFGNKRNRYLCNELFGRYSNEHHSLYLYGHCRTCA